MASSFSDNARHDTSVGTAAYIIDNGSYTCRIGKNDRNDPIFTFRNAIYRLRNTGGSGAFSQKNGRRPAFVVGGEAARMDPSELGNPTSAFDRNVVCNFHMQEKILDYAFYKLDVRGNSVDLPVVMTEPPCNPSYSRYKMCELLFECYRAPSVCFGVDSLFSLYHNMDRLEESDVPAASNSVTAKATTATPSLVTSTSAVATDFVNSPCVVVSCGHNASHVLPLWSAKASNRRCTDFWRRVPIGGSDCSTYLRSRLLLKVRCVDFFYRSAFLCF